MRLLLTAAIAALAALVVPAAGADGALIGIYRNDMDTVAKRSEVLKISGRSCHRGGSQRALRVTLGKRTDRCLYRTRVVGRDLEVAATARLLSGTPKPARAKAFVGLDLRAGGGGSYELRVFPWQRKFQLRKTLADGKVRYLAVDRGVAEVEGLNRANKLRLRAFNQVGSSRPGACRLVVSIGGKRVASVLDPRGGELDGRFSGVAVGSIGRSNGVIGSIDDVVVRVPSPF